MIELSSIYRCLHLANVCKQLKISWRIQTPFWNSCGCVMTVTLAQIQFRIILNINIENNDRLNSVKDKLIHQYLRIRHLATYAGWRHQMETFSALLFLCTENSRVTGEFPSERPVTRSFDAFFDLRLNKELSTQWRSRWLETPVHSLWPHSNGFMAKNEQLFQSVLCDIRVRYANWTHEWLNNQTIGVSKKKSPYIQWCTHHALAKFHLKWFNPRWNIHWLIYV